MSLPQNDLLLRALLKQETQQTPIWIMRQAGRYLPEYREIRNKVKDFTELYKQPDLVTEITLQPVERFPLDAAIIFSDILIVPEAMGVPLVFVENEGPRFMTNIRSQKDVEALKAITCTEHMPWLKQAIQSVRNELRERIPLIGFAGSPWTLATYLVEGKSKSSFREIKTMLYQQPEILKNLLEKLVGAVTDCLNMQIEAGADCVMLFDSWGGLLAEPQYLEFSLNPMKQIMQGLIKERQGHPIPCILFTKGGGHCLEAMADSGCDALGVDWTCNLEEARKRVGDRVALQGNLDPDVLTASDDFIRREAQRILNEFGPYPGHVFNLGHGITPNIDPDKVAVLVDAVHNGV